MIDTPDYIFPNENGFKGEVLDNYLAAGYYRMMHMVFTTNQTALDAGGRSVPVFWLRIKLQNVHENKTAISIRKKCALFSIEYKKAAISPETEELYSKYYGNIRFHSAPTCYDCLHDDYIENPFDSLMIEIRDNGTLIAAGYFDVGKNSITGILNFYHPAYKKYSLGKFLILKKLDYAAANNLLYYYTGYISTGTTKFDYKLFPDNKAIEVFLPVEKIWVPYEDLGKQRLEEYYYTYLI